MHPSPIASLGLGGDGKLGYNFIRALFSLEESLASVGVIPIEECLFSLYCFTKSSITFIYL